MAYIGRGLQSGAFRQLDDISSGFDGSDTTHTMQVNSTNVTVGDVNQILLSLGGVIQKPGTDFTVSGSVLTFTTAPAANTSFFAILLGSDNGGTVTPTDGSVTTGKIVDDAVTAAKVASSGAFAIGAAGTTSSIAGANILVEANSLFIGDDVSGTTDTAANSVAVGIDALDAVTTGDANVAVGKSALSAVNTGADNIGIGNQAGAALTTGTDNIAIGSNALATEDAGTKSIAIGANALNAQNVSGSVHNIAIGNDAGKLITTGLYNIMIGGQAGDGFDTESENLGIGTSALGGSIAGGEYNVCVGSNTLDALTSGDANTAVGQAAGTAVTTGANNTAVGYYCLQSLTEGQANTAIGKNVYEDLTTGNYNTGIGGEVEVSSSGATHQITIGYGIGSNGDSNFTFGQAGNRVYNNFTSNASWTRSSDERKKQNIKDDNLGLDFINELRPVTFQWKPSNEFPKEWDEYSEENNMDTEVVMHGLIAQEVKSALDNAGVDTFGGWTENTDGMQNISREMFVFPLIKAVQELAAKVKALEEA